MLFRSAKTIGGALVRIIAGNNAGTGDLAQKIANCRIGELTAANNANGALRLPYKGQPGNRKAQPARYFIEGPANAVYRDKADCFL